MSADVTVKCFRCSTEIAGDATFCAGWLTRHRANNVCNNAWPSLQGSMLVSCGLCRAFISDLGSHLDWHRKVKTK